MYGKYYMLGGVFKLAWSALVICGAFFFVRSLLLHVDAKAANSVYNPTWAGYTLAAGFFTAATLWCVPYSSPTVPP